MHWWLCDVKPYKLTCTKKIWMLQSRFTLTVSNRADKIHSQIQFLLQSLDTLLMHAASDMTCDSIYLLLTSMIKVEWHLSTSRLREYITSPSSSSPGSDLPWQAWVKLNRLRTGVGALQCWYVEMGPIQESSLRLRSRPTDNKSHHHGVPPIPSTKMVCMALLMLMQMQMQQLVNGY